MFDHEGINIYIFIFIITFILRFFYNLKYFLKLELCNKYYLIYNTNIFMNDVFINM